MSQVKTSDYQQSEQKEQKDDIRHSKMMAEVFLTRLLKTKVSVIFDWSALLIGSLHVRDLMNVVM